MLVGSRGLALGELALAGLQGELRFAQAGVELQAEAGQLLQQAGLGQPALRGLQVELVQRALQLAGRLHEFEVGSGHVSSSVRARRKRGAASQTLTSQGRVCRRVPIARTRLAWGTRVTA